MTRHPRDLQLSFAGGEMAVEMFDRVDDVRRRGAAALLRNAISLVTGPAERRPGLESVGKAKLPALSTPRLFPFVFNDEQALVIMAGRSTVDGRDIGYFRFYADGQPLLYPMPRSFVTAANTYTASANSTATAAGAPQLTDGLAAFPTAGSGLAGMTLRCGDSYGLITANTATTITLGAGWVGATPAAVSYYEISGVAAVTDELVFGANHAFATGDPVVLLASPTLSPVNFTAGSPGNFSTAAAPFYTFQLGGGMFHHGSAIMFATTGSLPPELEANRVYYAFNHISGWGISRTRYAPPIALTGIGANSTVAAMPSVPGRTPSYNAHDPVVPGTVHWAIATADPKRIKIAASKADALRGAAIDILKPGTGFMRVQYAYVPGDIALGTPGPFAAAVMKRPWGDPARLAQKVITEDYLGRPPTDTVFWCRVPGSGGAVTFNTTTDRVQLTAHGYSNGDPCIFSGTTAPAGLAFGVNFYVRNKTADDFQVSATPIGPVVDIGAGASAVSVFGNAFYEVPHYYSDAELFVFSTAQSNDVVKIASNRRPLAELRRLAPTRWELRDVTFGAVVPPPSDLSCQAPQGGQGMRITSVVNTATPSELATSNAHNFADGEPLHVTGLAAKGIPDGFYAVHNSTAPNTTQLFLQTYDGGDSVTASATGATTSGVARTSTSVAVVSEYVVTSIDVGGVESGAGPICSVTNNLFNAGARNPLQWSLVTGAVRYRIYKRVNGLFGLIGETEGAAFTDEGNQRPDLGISAPTPDTSLLREAEVTFDLVADTINWTGHALEEGDPVIFDSAVNLPTGLEIGRPFFAFNVGPNGDSFQVTQERGGQTAVALGGTPTGPFTVKAGHFPGSVCYFDQRLVLSGSFGRPADVWATASGTDTDLSYSVPTIASDRLLFRLASAPNTAAIAVRHAIPLSHLMMLGNSVELRVTPINDDALTPDSASVRPQSYIGAGIPQPSIVNGTVLFVAARGAHVREMGYQSDVSGYVTGDLSLRAEHLFNGWGIRQQTYAKAPTPICWFISTPPAGSTANNKLLGITYVPEEQVGGWHQHVTPGSFESVCAIPDGVEDRLYVVVSRDLGAGEEFHVERMGLQQPASFNESFHVDHGYTYLGPATTSIGGLDRFNGLSVHYAANGAPGIGIVKGGLLSVPAGTTIAHVGGQFVTDLKPMPAALQKAAYGSGSTKNVNQLWLRVERSGRFLAGPAPDDPTAEPAAADLRPSRRNDFTGKEHINIGGSWLDEGLVWIRQDLPLPLKVVSLTIEVPSGG